MKYSSKYGFGDEISAAQLAAETMCHRYAKKRKVQLPQKFWFIDEWKRTFLSQMAAFNKLATAFPEEVILKTIKENQNIYSLRPKFIIELVKKVHDRTVKESMVKERDEVKEEVKENKKVSFRKRKSTAFEEL